MLAFAIDHESPATIILVAGDRDYAYAMSTLRLRQYSIVLIVPPSPTAIPSSLESQASVVIDWNYAILGRRPDGNTPPVRQPSRDLDENIVERLSREIRNSNEELAAALNSSSYPTSTPPVNTRHVSAAELLQPSVFQWNTEPSDAIQLALSCTPKKGASVFSESHGRSSVGSVAPRARSTTQNMQTNPFQLAPTCTPKKAASILSETPGHSGIGVMPSPTQAVPTMDGDPGFPFTENNALPDENVADEWSVTTANRIQEANYDSFHSSPSTSPYHQNIAEPDSPPIVNSRHTTPSPSPAVTHHLGSRTGTPLDSSSHTRTISECTPISHAPPTDGRGDANTSPKSMSTGSVSDIMSDSILPLNRAALMDSLGLDDDEEHDSKDEDANISDGIANVSASSPVMTEVDDASDANVVDPAKLYSNEGWIFDDITKSPPANDTSESSGNPTTQTSSLTPSFSSNVSPRNVGIGSQQATSVINDNSNNISSGYQAPPVTKYVEDKIRRLTPPHFLPLLKLLLLVRSNGIEKPPRTKIAVALLQYDADAYKRAGVSSFKDYTRLAEEASLIELGGWKADAWIALHPDWFKAKTIAPKPPSPPTVRTYGSFQVTSQINVKAPTPFIAPTPQPAFAWQATTSKPKTRSSSGVSDELLPCFYPLITSLAYLQGTGMAQPLRSLLGKTLGTEVYARARVTNMKEYIALAMDAGIVECGGVGGSAWVSLVPDALSGRRLF
jgi:hypothetical protein